MPPSAKRDNASATGNVTVLAVQVPAAMPSARQQQHQPHRPPRNNTTSQVIDITSSISSSSSTSNSVSVDVTMGNNNSSTVTAAANRRRLQLGIRPRLLNRTHSAGPIQSSSSASAAASAAGISSSWNGFGRSSSFGRSNNNSNNRSRNIQKYAGKYRQRHVSNGMPSIPSWDSLDPQNNNDDSPPQPTDEDVAIADRTTTSIGTGWATGGSAAQRLRLQQLASSLTMSSSSNHSSTTSTTTSRNGIPTGPSNTLYANPTTSAAGDLGNEWMGWVASSIEFCGCMEDDWGPSTILAGQDCRDLGCNIGATTTTTSSNNAVVDGCGGAVSGGVHSVIGRALMLHPGGNGTAPRISNATAMDDPSNHDMDNPFCQLHEDFFDALLKEQATSTTATTATPDSSPLPLHRLNSIGEDSLSLTSIASMGTIGTSVSSHSSHTHETLNSFSSTRTHKRKRTRRLSSTAAGLYSTTTTSAATEKDKLVLSPIDAYTAQYDPALQPRAADALSLAQILQKEDLHEPIWYLAEHCRLQKDKGKGDSPLGGPSSLSATGRDACLGKLRDKIKIVVQASSEGTAGGTGMKRRPAKVSPTTTTTSTTNATTTTRLVETRSMIELRMGFLSMQYGLLLQWDVTTQKIVFCVLRKMCHDSFYNQKASSTRKSRHQQQDQQQSHLPNAPQKNQTADASLTKLPFVLRTPRGNDAIYCTGNTEVVWVAAPDPLEHSPDFFAASFIHIKVHSISGLSKQSRWTLSMTLLGQTEIAQLVDATAANSPDRADSLECRRRMTWPLHNFQNSVTDSCALEIRLFEQPFHRSKKHQTQSSACRLISSLTVPLGEWFAQPASQPTTVLPLTLPLLAKQTVATSTTHGSGKDAISSPASSLSACSYTNTQLTLELTHESEYAHWLYLKLQEKHRMGEGSSINSNPLHKGGAISDTSSSTSANTTSTFMGWAPAPSSQVVDEYWDCWWCNGIC